MCVAGLIFWLRWRAERRYWTDAIGILAVIDVKKWIFLYLNLCDFNIITKVVNYNVEAKIIVQQSKKLLHCADCGGSPKHEML